MRTPTKKRIPAITLGMSSNGSSTYTKPAALRVRAVWYLLIVASLGFVAAGSYTVVRGWDARNQIRNELVAQRITTPEDASIPNQLVDDAATAQSQADIIAKHALETTGGKTYSEMDRTDPARQTAFTAAALRTSLLSAVLAFNVANLAMGFGAFVAGIGLLLGAALVLLRPKFKTT